MGGCIFPPNLQLNKANASDTEAPFWGLFHPKYTISTITLILTS